MSYKEKLFDKYHSIHGANIDSDADAKLTFFSKYFNAYYKKFFPVDKTVNVLEIGCNKGYFLKVLEGEGYKNLFGIDLSHEDLNYAKQNTGQATIVQADAFDWCRKNPNTYDVIVIKAVLEHIDKDKLFTLFELMKKALKPEGILIIDVPNMDWLFAGHERYMDFTHEVGFTKESLSQVALNFFNRVEVFTAGKIFNTTMGKVLHFLAKKVATLLLRALDPEGNQTSWNDRNLIAVCIKQ